MKEAERIGDILSRVFKQRGLADRPRLARLADEIGLVVGQQRMRGVRVRSLQKGILTLSIQSATLRYEVENFYGGELVRRVQACPAGRPVSRIRYVIEG